jgi:hypothetical protein
MIIYFVRLKKLRKVEKKQKSKKREANLQIQNKILEELRNDEKKKELKGNEDVHGPLGINKDYNRTMKSKKRTLVSN